MNTPHMIEQYSVYADGTTGEWLDEPAYVGMVDMDAWSRRPDTEAAHYDTYEVKSDDGITTITRAIEVLWVWD